MSTPENSTTQPALTGSSKPTNDLMSLLGAGPAKKPKLTGNQSRAAVPLTRKSNAVGAGKPQPARTTATTQQGRTDDARTPEAASPETLSAEKQPVAPEVTEAIAPSPIEAPTPVARSEKHEAEPDIQPAVLLETHARPASAQTTAARSDAWRDELRNEAKEMTRAANYVASMLQQNKSVANIQAPSTRLNDHARSFVAAVTEDAESPAVVAERVSQLQKASGALMRAADKAASPEEALSFAQSRPHTASNAFLARSLEKAADRESARRTGPVDATPAQTRPAPAEAARGAENSPEESRAGAAMVELPAAPAIAGPQQASATEQQEPSALAEAQEQTDDVPDVAQDAEPSEEELPRSQQPIEKRSPDTPRVQSGLKLHAAPSGNDGVRREPRETHTDRSSIESFLEEPPVRTRGKQTKQPQRQPQSPAESTRPASAPEQAEPDTVEALLQEPRATSAARKVESAPAREDAAASVPPGPDVAPAADAERQTLGAVLREHMTERGFDNEAQRLAPTVASAVRDNGRFRSEEQSVVVLHKEGDRLATATTKRSLPVVALRGDSVLHAKTLEHIADHGLDEAIVRALRNAAPQATGSMTSLEIADRVGVGFLARASEEGTPRELLEQLREVSVETQRQLSEQTDKTLAQQFALEQASKRWGDERRSANDVLRSAPAAAVQMVEQVAEEQRANAVARNPAEPEAPEPQRSPTQEGERTRTFRFGGR